MKLIRKSLILFYDKSGKVLIQDRRTYKPGAAFGFFGGSLEKDENSEQAIVREIKEELSLNISKLEFVKEFKERTNEEDVIFYLYTAPLPYPDKITCREGKAVFTTLDEAKLLDMAPRGARVLQEFSTYLRKAHRIV